MIATEMPHIINLSALPEINYLGGDCLAELDSSPRK